MLPKTKSKPKHTLSDLTALVYGPSKIGKSTWCSKADVARPIVAPVWAEIQAFRRRR